MSIQKVVKAIIVSALRSDLANARWALLGNRCWIGLTVERHPDKAEYVAIYLPKPYAAPEIIPESYSDDFFDALAKGREWIETLDKVRLSSMTRIPCNPNQDLL